MTKTLEKYTDYNRKEVHDIFSPFTVFTPQAGTWGLHGIVKIPDRQRDYVFLVTFGSVQGEHAFDEEITEDGILSWQSQPQNTFKTKHIQHFIEHDHLKHNIYLFLRTSKKFDRYTYLGKLAYISHDEEREKPVYFKWQILDWEIPSEKAKQMKLELTPSQVSDSISSSTNNNQLIQTAVPVVTKRKKKTREFIARKVDFADNTAKNKDLGKLGEELVLNYEKKYLIENGRSDLADKVTHTSAVEGDGAGYDILSFDLNGQKKYIEIKTTKGGKSTPFYMSLNEIEFSRSNQEQFYIYRVYDFNPETKSGSFFVIKGNIEEIENIMLEPIQYKIVFQ